MSKSDQKAAQKSADQLKKDVTDDTGSAITRITGQQDTDTSRAGTDYTDTKAGLDRTRAQIGNARTAIGEAGNDFDSVSKYGKDFAETGGFTPGQENAYLNRATSGVKSAFDVLGESASRSGIRTGAGSGPAAIAQIARRGGQAQAEALNSAQVDLATMKNQNKLAGIDRITNAGQGKSGLAGQEGNLANTELGAAGLDKSLFDTNSNQITAKGQQILQALGLKYNTQAEAQDLLTKLANSSKGPLDNILGIAGTAAGVVQGAAGAYKAIK